MQTYYGSEFIVNAGLIRKIQDPGHDDYFCSRHKQRFDKFDLAGNIKFQQRGEIMAGTISAANGSTMNFDNGGTLSGSFTTGYEFGDQFSPVEHLPQRPRFLSSGSGTSEQTGGTFNALNTVIPNLQLVGGTLNLPAGFEGGAITSLVLNNQTLNGTQTTLPVR